LVQDVEYGFTKNLGNYQSERLSIRLSRYYGETAEQLQQLAKEWVESHLSITADELDRAHYEVSGLERQKAGLATDIQTLKQRYLRVREKLSSLGLVLPEDPEDLPF
jgi:chromosome segregation ATPase